MGGHAFLLSAIMFFLCLQIYFFTNYSSCEGYATVGEVESSYFQTCLIKYSAVNGTFPDAFNSYLSSECVGICNSMWTPDCVIPRDLVLRSRKNGLRAEFYIIQIRLRPSTLWNCVLCLVAMSTRCPVLIPLQREASLCVLLGAPTNLLHGVEIHPIMH